MALPDNELVVPSPQSTLTTVTGAVLETVKTTVTVAPVSAGFGVGLFTVTVGAPTGTTVVTEPVAWPVEPLLSVAVRVIVNVEAVV